MKTSVNLTLRQIAVGAIVAALVGFGIAAAGFGIGYNKNAPVAQPGSAAAAANPAESVAYMQVPGTGDNEDKKAEYRCAAGYMPVQVPVGKTVQSDGATYELKATEDELLDRQKSVTLHIALPTGVSAPAIIVNTAAHILKPIYYPQHVLGIALAPGGKGDYTLLTDAYAENYLDEGITDITICTTKTK